MAKITPVTTTILGGEKAWDYIELDLQSPRSKGFHRYRIILVNRDDRITEYKEDMGSSKKFKGARASIHIPSFFEHTVDELIELAQELRYEHKGDEYDVREIVGVFPFNQPWKPKKYK